jgi:hypothetical protein
MKLGPWVIMKMHPAERELRKVHQLTPALRELVARMARAEAKDAVQEVMEAQNLVWRQEPRSCSEVHPGSDMYHPEGH